MRGIGTGAAAITYGTNRLTNLSEPFQMVYGKGLAEIITGRLAGRFGTNTAMRMTQRLSRSAGGRIALSALGEAGEENLEGYLQAPWERFLYNPEERWGMGGGVAEPDAFFQEFLDKSDGTGRPERDFRQSDGLGDAAGAQIESEIADAARRNLKSQLLGAEVIAFKDLLNEYKRQFRAALFQAAPEAKTLLYQFYSKADYIVQTGRHSYYQNGFTKNVIVLGANATPSTLAHELFHRIDRWNQVSGTLKESLAKDRATLETASGGQIKEYLARRYPEAFTTRSTGKTKVFRAEYRGIADILNGFSNGTVYYG